jgi:predicted amidohydrolase
MRIAYIQFAPALADLTDTIRRLDELWPQAASADIVVLPELSNSGYNFLSREEAFETAESAEGGSFTKYLTSVCRTWDFHLVAGLNELANGNLYNSSVLVGPDGLEGVYRKLHLFWNEKDLFQPGDLGVPVFEVRGLRLAMLICFDWAFPEVWRSLALQAVDLVCHPCNLVLPGFAQRAIPGYALTNRYFVVTANRFGSERDLTFTGLSQICSPHGLVLSSAPADTPSVHVVDADLSLCRLGQITPRNHLLTDRRPDVYRT